MESSWKQDRKISSRLRGSWLEAPRFRRALIAVLLALVALTGCRGGPFGPTSRSVGEDGVHRIVESGQLRVGISGVQPPLNMKNKAGELIGLDVDLARALATAMNVELVLIERPFSELLTDLDKNHVDVVISSLTITPERNARVAFAGPYMISGATLLTREELLDDVDELHELDSPDRTWGALEGSTGEALIRSAFPQAKLVVTDDLASLLPRITAGEIHGFITDLPYVRFTLARNPDAGFAARTPPFTTEPLGIALPADSPLLTNLVQNYLNTLEYTGALIQMKARWLGGHEWLTELP